jgi:PKHD-type hydroxylase
MKETKIEPSRIPLYAYWDGAFTNEELDQIVKLGLRTPLVEAEINSSGKDADADQRIKFSTRACKINWMGIDAETNWIFEKLQKVFVNLNAKYFKYELNKFEPFQFTSYASDRQEFYGRHMDCSFGINDASTSRKLSVTVQLSDGADYEGGDLVFHPGSEPEFAPKKKGMIILFPSFIIHEVTPVTAGHRYSLVTWAHGPHFK